MCSSDLTYLYLPCVVIIATSLFSFYLPPGSDSKIDLAVNELLSQTVFLLLISDLLPPDANDPPYLGMIIIRMRSTINLLFIIISNVTSCHAYCFLFWC